MCIRDSIIPLLIILALAFGLLGLSYGQLFAMYRIGDAFVAWTGVELNGKLYPPNAGDGPSWDFWVDPEQAEAYRFQTVSISKWGQSPYGPPRGYPKPGSPECGGTADLVLRNVKGDGLYVTDSGYLVQVILVEGHWSDTSHHVKCGNNLCSRPCGEKIGDAWIYVQLDPKKLRGGTPVYVKVSEEDVEKFHSYVSSETSVISKLEQEAKQGDENAEQIRYLGHILEAELTTEVPFAWYPENSTLKIKLTGLPKCMLDYGYCGRIIHYHVYIGPPEGQVFVLKSKEAWCHYYHGGKQRDCYPRKMPWGYKWKKETITYCALVEAEENPQPIATTMTQVKMTDDTITTETKITTITVNKLVEKTVTFEKTATTTITVKAPKTTYVISNSQQAQQVAEAYQPPKPLTHVIYEKLMEFYEWLLNMLGLR